MQELISVYVVRVDFMVNLGSTNTVDCPSCLLHRSNSEGDRREMWQIESKRPVTSIVVESSFQ